MCSLENFKIDLKSLKNSESCFDYDLDDSYFGALDGSEVKHGSLHVSLSVRKITGFYELLFHTEGTITVACDRCLDDMDQPIETDNRLVVKLGEEHAEDDDLITVDEKEGIIDVAWFIYEFIALAIPIKHVHAPGKCNSAMIAKFNEYANAARSDDEQQGMDPRWNALLKLKE